MMVLQIRLAAFALLLAMPVFSRLRTSANALLLAMILAAQIPLLFFLNTGRYGLLAWPCLLLADVLVLREGAVVAIAYARKWRSIAAPP